MTGKRQLSEANRRYLRRLVADHGAGEIMHCVMSIGFEEHIRELSQSEFHKYVDTIKLGERFEEETKRAREAGSKNPTYDAEYAIYLETVEDAGQKLKTDPDHFKRWRETMKKKRLPVQRNLRKWERLRSLLRQGK